MAVPMPPPDPPDHGPHLGANGLVKMLEERANDWCNTAQKYDEEGNRRLAENARARLLEAHEIANTIYAALAAQKEQQHE